MEDPVQFVERVYQAHVAQLNTQYTIRRNYYIDCMPTEKLYQVGVVLLLLGLKGVLVE